MKKLDYLLLYFYSLMVVAVICHTIFHFVGFQWGKQNRMMRNEEEIVKSSVRELRVMIRLVGLIVWQ